MATGTIRTGVYGHLIDDNTTSPLYYDLDGEKLYYVEAPENPGTPYCVFYIFEQLPERTFDLEFEHVFVQFNYYGKTANECDDGVIDLIALYDYANLTVSGYSALEMERDMIMPSIKIEPDDVYEAIVRYTLLIQKD